jgi:hypothetical protein
MAREEEENNQGRGKRVAREKEWEERARENNRGRSKRAVTVRENMKGD